MAQEVTDSAPVASPSPPEIEYAGVRISLENCLFPPESIEVTPSQKDGLDIGVENDLRRIGCEFIQIAGILLKVPQVAMATAQVLFQRFFFSKSFVKHKMEEIAMACIWLATKVEECPRRVRDVINVFHYLRLKRNNLPIAPMVLDQDYVFLKTNVIKSERRLLKELGFCVHVKHPHKIIVVYLQVLEMEKNRELVQTAWNYMSDSLQTTVFVQYSPETIACACIYLAARVLQIPLPTRPQWFYLFNVTEEDIQKISLTVLQVYQTVKTTYDTLEKKVESCRAKIQEEKNKAKGLSLDNPVSANVSPASRNASPLLHSPLKESKAQPMQRSSTVPIGNENPSINGNENKSDNERSKRSHGNGIKRSRTRSHSNNRSLKYRRSRNSSTSSSENSSDHAGQHQNDRIQREHSSEASKLPKSYSHHNSRHLDDKRRHRRRKTEGKSRHSKSHRRGEDSHRNRDRSHNHRHGNIQKKHKRKTSGRDRSPIGMPLSHINGEKMSSQSPSSSNHHRHHDGDQKKKPRRSLSPSRVHSGSRERSKR